MFCLRFISSTFIADEAIAIGEQNARFYRFTSISLLTTEDLKNAFIEENGFLAAMKKLKNRGKPAGSAVCVVDPAMTGCKNMGLAAFLLYTLKFVVL